MLGEMLFIEGLEEGQLASLGLACERGRRIEVENAGLGRTNERALIQRWQPAIGIVFAVEGGQAFGMREHHVSGQVIGLAAESIREP